MQHPIRVLIAKIGLDGHDRGAKLIVRHLRDAGMDVIYTGLWRTPAASVQAAVQEDVDILGASLHSAAHMTIMPEVVRLCREAGIPDTPVIVGGIIPAGDYEPLLKTGVAAIYNPGTSLEKITRSLTELAEKRRAAIQSRPNWKKPDLATPTGLAHAMTLVVNAQADAVLAEIPPLNVARPPSAGISQPSAKPAGGGRAASPLTIGVTGAPGVGKSSFIARFAKALRQRGHRVAVIAVDPSSPITGGSVLGDRLRMMSNEPDDGLFIRSLASRNVAGGIGPHAADCVRLAGAAGYPIVLVETVGAGQGDTEVRKVAGEVLMLVMPGAGDVVQFFKAGIMEIATGFVVNKCDLAGADNTIRELTETIEDNRPIWPVSSLRDEGVEPLCEWVEQKLV